MFGRFGFRDKATAVIERAKAFFYSRFLAAKFAIGGVYRVDCFDSGGNLRWSTLAKNGVTDLGIATILNVFLRAQAGIASWYIGLIDNAGFTALASSDIATSHVGWSEVAGTNYSDANRIVWLAGAAASGAVVNPTSSDFHMIPSAALTVRGLFLISDNTKGGTIGTLFSTAAFTGGNQIVNNGDTLKVTYTVSAVST